MALKGLVIRQPWIGMILRGEKTWEMRSTPCRYRGRIALIEKGSGTVVGLADLVGDLPPLGETELRSTFEKHRIPPDQLPEAVRHGWVRPWVLTNVSRLLRPLPYKHTSGGSWVNLSAQEEAAVLGSAAKAGARPPSTITSVTSKEAQLARRTLSRFSQAPAGSTDASPSIRRRGNKLYIDFQWEDDLPQPRSWKRPAWLDLIGLLGVAFAAFSALAMMIHLPLAILSSSFTILGALKWFPVMVVSMLVAVIGGHGDDLNEVFGSR